MAELGTTFYDSSDDFNPENSTSTSSETKHDQNKSESTSKVPITPFKGQEKITKMPSARRLITNRSEKHLSIEPGEEILQKLDDKKTEQSPGEQNEQKTAPTHKLRNDKRTVKERNEKIKKESNKKRAVDPNNRTIDRKSKLQKTSLTKKNSMPTDDKRSQYFSTATISESPPKEARNIHSKIKKSEKPPPNLKIRPEISQPDRKISESSDKRNNHIRKQIEKYLAEVARPSVDKTQLVQDINVYFKEHPSAVMYLYKKEFPLINRLHLFTKLTGINFNINRIVEQIKEAVDKSERINLEYLNNENPVKRVKGQIYKNKDGINIAHFAIMLNDLQSINKIDLDEVKNVYKTNMKEKKWIEGEKLYSDYNFKNVRKEQRDRWLKERKTTDSEISNLYKNTLFSYPKILYKLLDSQFKHLKKVHSQSLCDPSYEIPKNEGIMDQGIVLLIDFEKLLGAEKYAKFDDECLDLLLHISTHKTSIKEAKKEMQEIINNSFRNMECMKVLKSTVEIMNTLQQKYSIYISVNEDFLEYLRKFFVDEYSLKFEATTSLQDSASGSDSQSVVAPSDDISKEELYQILQLRLKAGGFVSFSS